MVWQISKKDFLNNIITSRFIISCFICLLVIPFAIYINIYNYENEKKVYETEKDRIEQELKNVKVYSFYRPEILREPEPLSIFCSGIIENIGNSIKIKFKEKPMFMDRNTQERENPLLSSFFNIDFISIIAILLSLIALIFSYDAFIKERTDCTLKLMLINSISKTKVYIGKFFGITLTILPILFICYTLSILLIVINPNISFGVSEWGRILLLFFISIFYFMVFVALGFFLSVVIRNSVSSIIISLLLWILFLFIVPNVNIYIAEFYVKPEKLALLDYEFQKIDDDYLKHSQTFEKKLQVPSYPIVSSGPNDDGGWQVTRTSIECIEYYHKLAKFQTNILLENASKKEKLQTQHIANLIKQANLARWISCISPAEIFKHSSTSVCFTDANSYWNFMKQVQEYYESFIKSILKDEIINSLQFVTPITKENILTADEIISQASNGKYKTIDEANIAQQSLGIIRKAIYTDNKFPKLDVNYYSNIDFNKFPSFSYPKYGVEKAITNSLTYLGILVLMLLILLAITIFKVRVYKI